MILRRNSKTTTSQKESNLNIYANPYDYDDHSDEFSSKPFYYENKNQNNDLKTFSNKSKFHKKQGELQKHEKNEQFYDVCHGFYELLTALNQCEISKLIEKKNKFFSDNETKVGKPSEPLEITKSSKKFKNLYKTLKKSLEEDSNVNKNLLEALRKKQIEETHNLKDILKDDRIIGNCSHFLTETKTEYSSKTIDEQIFDKKPLQKPIYPDFSHVLSKHKVFHSEKEKYFLSQDNKKLIPQNESLLKPKKNEPKPDSFVESKPNTFAFYETPNPNIANLELMLMNLKNRSLEPNLLNMQGSKDSAFTILNFLGTVQSEISSYLYNLGMNSKHNNESKFEKINNFFTNLGNSNLLTPFLFPHLHVNNNSNIFNQKRLIPPFKRAGSHVAIAYSIFLSKNKEKTNLDPTTSDPTYPSRFLREKKQHFHEEPFRNKLDEIEFETKPEKHFISDKLSEDFQEHPDKLISLFSASTKKSGEDLLGDALPKKMSLSILSLDELIPRNAFQTIFQNTPYKSNFKKISSKNSPFSGKQLSDDDQKVRKNKIIKKKKAVNLKYLKKTNKW